MRKQVLHPRTLAMNQKQKNQSKQNRLQALRWLQTEFPAAFDNRTQIRPLNIGIMHDILNHADRAALVGISKSKLREAVVLYTRRLDYLACLKARELRIDLWGNAGVPVNEEEAESAALKIKKRVEKAIKNAKKAPNSLLENPHRTKPIGLPGSYEAERSIVESGSTRNVSVTRKQSRVYDPEVVARLKEKLGLSQQKSGSVDNELCQDV